MAKNLTLKNGREISKNWYISDFYEFINMVVPEQLILHTILIVKLAPPPKHFS
jgi:hypothetical protein